MAGSRAVEGAGVSENVGGFGRADWPLPAQDRMWLRVYLDLPKRGKVGRPDMVSSLMQLAKADSPGKASPISLAGIDSPFAFLGDCEQSMQHHEVFAT